MPDYIVPIYTKSKAKHRRKQLRAGFLWLLVIAGLGLLGWILWNAGKPTENQRATKSEGSVPTKIVERSEKPSLTDPTNVSPLTASVPAVRINSVAVPLVIKSATSRVVATQSFLSTLENEFVPGPVQNVLEAQIAMALSGISPGSLDGALGSQTRGALRAFQRREKLPVTEELDAITKGRLGLNAPILTNYTVTSNDLAHLEPVSPTWLGKSQQARLDYETILELISEKGQSHPGLIRRLNQGIDWSNIMVGARIRFPNIEYPKVNSKAAFVRISLASKFLEAFDPNTNLLAHFPCSIAQRVEKRPAGELHVAVIVPNPNYSFDPEVFTESAEARELGRKLIIPPGPNNPVGSAWIGLDKPGYGIHGTPRPEEVGRTESHGCFRLANWNAEYLSRLVWIGMPVYVEP
ncbi:MAG: L,D-transpeptidase family protein [Verrucomicrobiota bacterium]